MAALLGLHTIVCIKKSHKKWHRKCLNTMCARSDVFSTANMEQKELSRLFVLCYILKTQQERGKSYDSTVVASSSSTALVTPTFCGNPRVCSHWLQLFLRHCTPSDIKHPRHPVFTANWQLSICQLVSLKSSHLSWLLLTDVNRKKEATTSWCASYISSSQTFGGMHLNSSTSFRIFFHPYSFNRSWYNNAAGSRQRPAVSL